MAKLKWMPSRDSWKEIFAFASRGTGGGRYEICDDGPDGCTVRLDWGTIEKIGPAFSRAEARELAQARRLEAAAGAAAADLLVSVRDLTRRIKACGETLELCVDELKESGIDFSSDVFKTWRAADKHLCQLIADLEAECAEPTESR